MRTALHSGLTLAILALAAAAVFLSREPAASGLDLKCRGRYQCRHWLIEN